MRLAGLIGLACVLALAGPVLGQPYDVGPITSSDGMAVPDVNKAGVGMPAGPAPDDYGCWAATAANILGAAGWGVGATAQQKANAVYQDFINQFGDINGVGKGYIDALGDGAAATKWWVHNIGLNQAQQGQGYTPTETYINFRKKTGTLYEIDYNFLLDQLSLDPSQYIGVKWMIPDVGGHCVTLVGGNYGPMRYPPPQVPPVQISVWHDSDTDAAGGLADEPRPNKWGNNTEWGLNMVGGVWWGDGYFTACPGVPKPVAAIDNFDVHYYVGITQVQQPVGEQPYYNTGPMMLTTGVKYGTYTAPTLAGDDTTTDPYWEDPGAETPTLIVPNEKVDNWLKKLYLSVDFNDPLLVPVDGLGNPITPDIQVYDDSGNQILLTLATWASDNGQVLLEYDFIVGGLDEQPAYEKIVFPSDAYLRIDKVENLGYNIYEWNLATECVPEPATMALLGLGVAGLLARRRTR